MEDLINQFFRKGTIIDYKDKKHPDYKAYKYLFNKNIKRILISPAFWFDGSYEKLNRNNGFPQDYLLLTEEELSDKSYPFPDWVNSMFLTKMLFIFGEDSSNGSIKLLEVFEYNNIAHPFNARLHVYTNDILEVAIDNVVNHNISFNSAEYLKMFEYRCGDFITFFNDSLLKRCKEVYCGELFFYKILSNMFFIMGLVGGNIISTINPILWESFTNAVSVGIHMIDKSIK